MDSHLKFYGWGVEDTGLDEAERQRLFRFLADRLGVEPRLVAPPRVGDISLRATRVAAPGTLARMLTDDPYERLLHTYGKSYPETVRTWGSTTKAVLALREYLIAEQVSLVVMEATGNYWKPFYYLLEDADFEVMLVNARQVKNLPGRKSDVSDAAWLAQLGAHGLLRGSFVPPAPIRQLRDLTRARTMMTRERGREIQRLEKLLEDAGINCPALPPTSPECPAG